LRILRKLHAFRSLGSDEKRLFVEAFFVPVFIATGFRVLGVPRTQAWLRKWAADERKASERLRSDRDTIRAVRRAQRIIKRVFRIGGTCLVRSFTLWALLLRQGVASEVRVGFRKSNSRMEGHSWVEYEGVPVNEVAAVRSSYSVFKDPATFDRQI
jgi:hypothetical protein